MNSNLLQMQAQAKLDDLHQQALNEQQLNKDPNQLSQTLATILRYFANKLDPQLGTNVKDLNHLEVRPSTAR